MAICGALVILVSGNGVIRTRANLKAFVDSNDIVTYKCLPLSGIGLTNCSCEGALVHGTVVKFHCDESKCRYTHE